MAKYWPSSFLRFYGQDKVYKNAKKGRDQYPATLTEQAWSVKDLLSRGAFPCGPTRVAQSEHRILFIPARSRKILEGICCE